MPGRTLGELASLVGGKVEGDASVTITGGSALDLAQPGELAFLQDERQIEAARRTRASAVILRDASLLPQRPSLVVEDPYLAFAKIMGLFVPPPMGIPEGVHPSAIVSSEATLASGVRVGPYVVIERGAVLGARVRVGPFVFIGADVSIGEESCVYPHVSLLERVRIGKRVIIHSGTVVGSDGFGYVKRPDRSLFGGNFP